MSQPKAYNGGIREYSGVLKRADFFRDPNYSYKKKHIVEIFDEEHGSILECTCGMRRATLTHLAEEVANNHERVQPGRGQSR